MTESDTESNSRPDTGPDSESDRRDRPRVMVYSKPGCHLCETAVAIVAQVCAEQDVTWGEQDISGDAQLMETYGEQIPVTFVDGRQHDFWRVDAGRLRGALR